MSDQERPPLPKINPAVLERWNRLQLDTPLKLEMQRQDWDNLLAALLDLNEANAATLNFIGSVASQNVDWSQMNRGYHLNGLAQNRLVRFIETFMLRAAP
jgi:hypothetical protein